MLYTTFRAYRPIAVEWGHPCPRYRDRWGQLVEHELNVCGLGYLGVRTADMEAWKKFATDILGMEQIADTGDGARYKMDLRTYRLAVTEGEPGLGYIGWEVLSARHLDAVSTSLASAGVGVTVGTSEDAALRKVAGLIRAKDPAGNDLEFFWGASVEEVRVPKSAHDVRFVTGDQGMGHVVLTTTKYREMVDFYADTLGFYTSDVMVGHPSVSFLGCNERHHSIALLDAPVDALHHFMVQVEELDMVGQSYDRVHDQNLQIVMTLGRHWNDHMTSFYVESPSGFAVEFGWNGRRIDRSTWATVLGSGEISFWGHRPVTKNQQ